MDECLTQQQWEQYRRGEMDTLSLSRAEAHLRHCDRCRGVLRETVMQNGGDQTNSQPSRRAVERLLGPAAVPAACPAPEELTRYAERASTSVEQEIVESHLANCGLCRDDVAALTTLRAEMASFDWDAARREAIAPHAVWMNSFWTMLFPPAGTYRVAPLWIGAAVTVVAVFILTNLWTRSTIAPLDKQIARLKSENARLTRQATAAEERLRSDSAAQQEKEKRLAALERSVRVAAIKQRDAEKHAQIAARETQTLRQQIAALRPSIERGSATVVLQDNRRTITRDAAGQVRVDGKALPTSLLQKELDTVLRTGRAPIAVAAAELMRLPAATVLRGGNGDAASGVPFALIAPLGVVVESNQPTFRWKPLNPSATYIVSVYDKSYNEAAISQRLTGTTWQVAKPLRRGEVYTWRVTALGGSEFVSPTAPAPEARFRVLDSGGMETVRRARRSAVYKDSSLLMGLLYARVGLVSTARQEFVRLAKDNPDSLAARRLLESVSAPVQSPPTSTNGAQ